MVEILQNTEKLLKENKDQLTKNAIGNIKDILNAIWDEYLKYDRKYVSLSITMQKYEPELTKMGFKCNISIKWGQPVFYVSWE